MSQDNPSKRVKHDQSDEYSRSSPRGSDQVLDRRTSREFNAPPPHYGSNMTPPNRGYDDRGAFARGASFPRGPPPPPPPPPPHYHTGIVRPASIGYYDNRGPYNRDAPSSIPLQRSVSDPYNRNRARNFDDLYDRDMAAPRDYRFNNHRDPPFRYPLPDRAPVENLVVPHRREGWREEWKAKANNLNQPPPQDPYYNNSMNRDRPMVKKYFAFRRAHNSPVNTSPNSNPASNTVSTPSSNVSKSEASKPRQVIRDHEIITLTNTIDTILDYKMVLALLPLNISVDDPTAPSNSSNKDGLNLLNPALIRQDSKSITTPRQGVTTPSVNSNADKVRGTPVGAMSNRTPDNTNLSGQRTASSAPQSQGFYRQNSNNPPRNGSNYR